MKKRYYQRKIADEEFVRDPVGVLEKAGYVLKSDWDDPVYVFEKEYGGETVRLMVSEGRAYEHKTPVRYVRLEWESVKALKAALSELELKLLKIEEPAAA